MEPTPRERFAALADLPDERIDVAEGALLVAAEEQPGLEIAPQLEALAALARVAEPALARARGPRARARALCAFVASEGFRGNRDDYYDPRNSYLNEVLARRVGIPITLALVYLEIARRHGLPVHGVSFPGHFLLKYAEPESRPAREILIDPFEAALLDDDDVRERFKLAMGPETPFHPRWLRAATAREILVRLLGNLKQIHAQRGELDRALACCDRILLLVPGAPFELRDRGLVYQQLECFGPALADLERFLALAPRDASANTVRELLPELREKARQLH